YSPFDGRYGADGGPMHATYTPDCRPIRKAPAQPNATRPASTVHDLISSPRAFAGRAAPKERLVDSADVPAPRLTARGAQALLLVSRGVGVARHRAALDFGGGDRLRGRRVRLGVDPPPHIRHVSITATACRSPKTFSTRPALRLECGL